MLVIENQQISNFKEYVDKRIPVLIKNGLNEFEQLQKWTEDYIINKYGHLECKISKDSRPVRSKTKTTYQDFFHNKFEDFYSFTRIKYDKNNKLFIEDITFPNKFLNEFNLDKHIFFSGPKNTGALPHEHGNALNLLVYGKKKWVMFDTYSEKGKAYQTYYYKKYKSGHKSIDWFNTEYNKISSDIKLYECIQESNDIIFIPKGYSHTTLNETKVLGIVLEF